MKFSPRTLLICLLVLSAITVASAGHRPVRGRAPRSRKNIDRDYRRARTACERSDCRGLGEPDFQNCVYKCVSEDCYKEVYGQDEIEEGEVDIWRARQFTQCYRAQKKGYPPQATAATAATESKGEGESGDQREVETDGDPSDSRESS